MSEEEFIEEPEALYTVEVDQKLAKDGRYTYRSTRVSIEASCDIKEIDTAIDDMVNTATKAIGKSLSLLKANEVPEDE